MVPPMPDVTMWVVLTGSPVKPAADDREHDESNALLPVVRTMRKAHSGTGHHQNTAHPPNGWVVTDRLIQMRIVQRSAAQQIQAAGENEAEQRRDCERFQHLPQLRPMHSLGNAARAGQGVARAPP